MFEWLAEFNTVLVTGPQRSGTRIASRMIAHDIGYEHIDEDAIHMDSIYKLYSIITEKNHIVVQCPVLCRYVHMLADDHVAVVLMRRNIEDIIASQKRIQWMWEWLELARYDRSDGIISEVKYQFWDQVQKVHIKHAFEVEYESLAAHPLWIAKELRQNFEADQTAHPAKYWEGNQSSLPVPSAGVFLFKNQEQVFGVLLKDLKNAKALNEVGRFVWDLCDGEHTYLEILQALRTQFTDVDESTLKSDLNNFISDLIFDGFLHINDLNK
jgi:hypothetical protein